MRIMLRTWLRVSECLSLCPADPPIISLRSEVTGNKVKRGREVHIPILEPVVNRRQAPDDLLQAIIEDGYAYSEERSQAQIPRWLRALYLLNYFPPAPCR